MVKDTKMVGKIALFGKFWYAGWFVRLANVCNVGG